MFDSELALKRCANKPGLVAEMMQYFFADMDDVLPQMHAALEQGDLEAVGRLGHRLKGTVVYLGAEPAQAAALRVERCCTSSHGTRAEAEAAVTALTQECGVLSAALRQQTLAAARESEGGGNHFRPGDQRCGETPDRK